MFLSTQLQGRKERIELIQYLEENHKVVEIESDNSMLGLLKQEVRDNLAWLGCHTHELHSMIIALLGLLKQDRWQEFTKTGSESDNLAYTINRTHTS